MDLREPPEIESRRRHQKLPSDLPESAQLGLARGMNSCRFNVKTPFPNHGGDWAGVELDN